MGLRCLLGHDFGEPETERERNEEGNEVVVTVREVKTCERCGEKQVVSENKEIKSIDQLRESATGGAEPTTSGPSTGADEWGTDEPTGTAGADETATAEQSTGGADQWSADELEVGGETADAEPTEDSGTADEGDGVDKGVAEIIESAEKDDEMLQADAAEEEDEEDETPVHPGQRSPDEEEEHDVSEEDAEILDDESPPEDGREQWDEQADPAQVPGQDRLESEPGATEDDDAVIMGGEDATAEEPAVEESDPVESEPAESAEDEPTAVESEDAVILDDDSGEPAEPTEEAAQSEPADTVESEDAVVIDESADESGHTPWPETPGEDEGHDATEPDGEPADVEFGGGITPDQPRNEENGAQAGASPEEPVGETAQSSADAGSSEAGSSGGARSPEPNINLEQSSREAQLEYYCPECGLTREVGNSSMRAGDICPECRKGYIEEQERSA